MRDLSTSAPPRVAAPPDPKRHHHATDAPRRRDAPGDPVGRPGDHPGAWRRDVGAGRRCGPLARQQLDDISDIRRVLEIAVLGTLSLGDSLARSRVLVGAVAAAGKLLEAAWSERWGDGEAWPRSSDGDQPHGHVRPCDATGALGHPRSASGRRRQSALNTTPKATMAATRLALKVSPRTSRFVQGCRSPAGFPVRGERVHRAGWSPSIAAGRSSRGTRSLPP